MFRITDEKPLHTSAIQRVDLLFRIQMVSNLFAVELQAHRIQLKKIADIHREKDGNLDGAISDISKAIILGAKSYYFQHRGTLYYLKGDWEKAAEDFKRYLWANGNSRGHGRYHLWVARSRMGEGEAATAELSRFLAGNKDIRNTPYGSLGLFLVGDLTEAELLFDSSLVKSGFPDDWCGAYYYLGVNRLLNGDKEGAKAFFHKTLETRLTRIGPYRSAVAELRWLEEK